MAKLKTQVTLKTARALLAQRDDINKQLADVDFKPVLIAELAPIFEANPKLRSIGWKQFAPGFNDGDPCIFSVHNDADSLLLNGVDGYGDRYDEDEDEDGTPDEKQLPKKLYVTVADALAKFTEDDYQTMFGEGARVRVT